MRAFLGASNLPRDDRNYFTDFAESDNPRMSTLANGPLHVVNIALNVVSSKNLAWQERKAESFTVTRLHSGCGSLGAFRATKDYDSSMSKGGVSLGTAMAISGAAASPNMGYNSSPALTFLMAMFNVRLGWWLPNPGRAGDKFIHTDGPKCALGPLLAETFGLTTDNRPFVYLSDGGHFENLGLYEMVRRRCRLIVVSDAGCDPECTFSDLGNALRKIRIDLGIEIDIPGLEDLRARRERTSNGAPAPCHAIGCIRYKAADGNGSEDGILLYIKPGLDWTEPADIQSYAMAHKEFPHETTSDQWFSESQFESYRKLGFTIGERLLPQVFPGASLKEIQTEAIPQCRAASANGKETA